MCDTTVINTHIRGCAVGKWLLHTMKLYTSFVNFQRPAYAQSLSAQPTSHSGHT